MIIDIILDRREGAIDYTAATHLKAIYDYATFFHMNNLAAAVDGGTEDDAPAATAADKLAIIRKVAARLRRNIKRDRLAIVHDRRLGDINYLEAVEALTCGELGTEDPNPTEILLSVIYGTGLPAEKADAIEDALISAVNALPFPADDIFRGTGDGTREYTALFTL
jgi:hypothetical protein